MKNYFILFLSVLFFQLLSAQDDSTYLMGNIPIGSGEEVTGLYANPANGNILYGRTAHSGLFQYDKQNEKWTSLMKDIPYNKSNISNGIEGVAIDKNNPNVLYMACGMYRYSVNDTGDVWKSVNGGQTWKRTNLNVMMFSAWENMNHSKERLVIDPNNSNVLYFASRANGLWRSTNAGGSWQQMSSFPVATNTDIGISCLFIDGNSASGGKSQKLYAAVYNQGLYKSTDAGATWSLLNGDFKQGVQGIVVPNGNFYFVDYQLGLYKFDGTNFSYLTPIMGTYYGNIAIAPNNPNLIYMQVAHPWQSYSPIYRSTNGGANWQNITANRVIHKDIDWWETDYFSKRNSSLLIDASDNNKIWIGDNYGVWYCDNTTTLMTHWYAKNQNMTTVQAHAGFSQGQGGLPLVANSHDFAGFKFDNIFLTVIKSVVFRQME